MPTTEGMKDVTKLLEIEKPVRAADVASSLEKSWPAGQSHRCCRYPGFCETNGKFDKKSHN